MVALALVIAMIVAVMITITPIALAVARHWLLSENSFTVCSVP
jgi:hypothetical protein